MSPPASCVYKVSEDCFLQGWVPPLLSHQLLPPVSGPLLATRTSTSPDCCVTSSALHNSYPFIHLRDIFLVPVRLDTQPHVRKTCSWKMFCGRRSQPALLTGQTRLRRERCLSGWCPGVTPHPVSWPLVAGVWQRLLGPIFCGFWWEMCPPDSIQGKTRPKGTGIEPLGFSRVILTTLAGTPGQRRHRGHWGQTFKWQELHDGTGFESGLTCYNCVPRWRSSAEAHGRGALCAGAQPWGHTLPSASGGPDHRSLPPRAAGGRSAETPRTAPSHWGSFGRRARPPSRHQGHTANRPGALWSGSCPTP